MALLLHLYTCMWGLQEDFLLPLLLLNWTFCSCGLFVFRYLLPCVLANKFSEVLSPPGVSVGSLLPAKEGESTEYLFLSCTGRGPSLDFWFSLDTREQHESSLELETGGSDMAGAQSHTFGSVCQKKVSPEWPLRSPWSRCDQVASSLESGVHRHGGRGAVLSTASYCSSASFEASLWACIKLWASCLCLEERLSLLFFCWVPLSLSLSGLTLAPASETYSTSWLSSLSSKACLFTSRQ